MSTDTLSNAPTSAPPPTSSPQDKRDNWVVVAVAIAAFSMVAAIVAVGIGISKSGDGGGGGGGASSGPVTIDIELGDLYIKPGSRAAFSCTLGLYFIVQEPSG